MQKISVGASWLIPSVGSKTFSADGEIVRFLILEDTRYECFMVILF